MTLGAKWPMRFLHPAILAQLAAACAVATKARDWPKRHMIGLAPKSQATALLVGGSATPLKIMSDLGQG